MEDSLTNPAGSSTATPVRLSRLQSGELPSAVLRSLQLFAALNFVCLAAELISRVKHYGFPYVWPLMSYYDRFVDFDVFTSRFPFFHTTAFFKAPGMPFTYPAPLSVVFALFFSSPWPLQTYLVTAFFCFAIAGILFGRALHNQAISIRGTALLVLAFAASFPLWFDLQQANCEWVVWAITAVGLWSVLKDRYYSAAVFFGAAASMKLFPFVFFALFLKRRSSKNGPNYKAFVLACCVAVGLTLSSFWVETTSVRLSYHGTLNGLAYFGQHWTMKADRSGFDHSLFALVKLVAAGHLDPRAGQASALLGWYMLTVAVGGTVLFFVRLQAMPLVNQILALTVVAILLPPVSFDYTLINLYVPCSLLVLCAIQVYRSEPGEETAGMSAALLTMAVLLAPETEFIKDARPIGGTIKCLALCFLLFLANRYPFPFPRTLGRYAE